jgi:hypothetical protein
MSIQIAKWKDSCGNTQRAGMILGQEVYNLVRSGDYNLAKSFVSDIMPSEWHPATMLGFLRIILILSSAFKPEFDKLVADTRAYLSTLPDWGEGRIAKATSGL